MTGYNIVGYRAYMNLGDKTQTNCYLPLTMSRGGKREGSGRKPNIKYPQQKRCPACNNGEGTIKPGTDFYPDRSTGRVSGLCKECHRRYRRASYAKNGQPESHHFAAFKAHAHRRGLRVTLAFEQFRDLRTQPCSYGDGRRPEVKVGIDRKDCSIGYTPGNSVPCCPRHNEIKREFFSFKDMMFIVANVPSAGACGNSKAGRKRIDAPAPFHPA